jgi:hypothetical protein
MLSFGNADRLRCKSFSAAAKIARSFESEGNFWNKFAG